MSEFLQDPEAQKVLLLKRQFAGLPLSLLLDCLDDDLETQQLAISAAALLLKSADPEAQLQYHQALLQKLSSDSQCVPHHRYLLMPTMTGGCGPRPSMQL